MQRCRRPRNAAVKRDEARLDHAGNLRTRILGREIRGYELIQPLPLMLRARI
jgi:hypothetical protein